MAAWIQLTADHLSLVLHRDEREAVLADDPAGDVVRETLADVTVIVREAVANCTLNVLDGDTKTIPASLKDCALDIVAWRLAKRLDLSTTDDRKQAYADAKERLAKVASCEWRVTGPDGLIASTPGKSPWIQAPRPAIGNDAVGIVPVPQRPFNP